MRRLISAAPIFWVLLFTGLVLRLGFVLSQPNACLAPDETDYVESAMGLLKDGSFDKTVYYHVPPAVPVLYSAVFAFTGPSYLAARLLQVLLCIPLGLLLFALGRELADPLAGYLALAAGMLYPYFIYFTGYALTETLATVLIAGLILAAVRAVRDTNWRSAAWFGAAVAAGALTRSSIFYFVLAIPLVFLIGKGLRPSAWLKPTAAALAAFMALYAPWMAVNYHYFGRIVTSPTIGGGVMLYQTALRITMPDDVERMAFLKREILPKYYYPEGAGHPERFAGDQHLAAEGKRMLLENLDRFPGVIWHNLKRFWQFYPNAPENEPKTKYFYKICGLASYGLLFPLMLAGACVGIRSFRRWAPLFGFIAYFTLLHILVYGKLRYRIPMDGLLLVMAAAGASALLHWFQARYLSPAPASTKDHHSQEAV